jgi:hypothetical protein
MRLTAAPSAAPHWRGGARGARVCDGGSTMRGARVWAPPALSCRGPPVPRGDSVAPNPVPAHAGASTAG